MKIGCADISAWIIIWFRRSNKTFYVEFNFFFYYYYDKQLEAIFDTDQNLIKVTSSILIEHDIHFILIITILTPSCEATWFVIVQMMINDMTDMVLSWRITGVSRYMLLKRMLYSKFLIDESKNPVYWELLITEISVNPWFV